MGFTFYSLFINEDFVLLPKDYLPHRLIFIKEWNSIEKRLLGMRSQRNIRKSVDILDGKNSI